MFGENHYLKYFLLLESKHFERCNFLIIKSNRTNVLESFYIHIFVVYSRLEIFVEKIHYKLFVTFLNVKP